MSGKKGKTNSRKLKNETTKKVSDEEFLSEQEEEEQKAKSTFMNECEKAFGTADFYGILNLEKEKASLSDIKKSYYKLSLRYHPDKVTDESLKEESKIKFQCLGKIYSILSDDEKKKFYDETGLVDGEYDMFKDNQQDWDDYFRTMFKKVTKNDIDNFFKSYKNSKEERNDLIAIYEKCCGDMESIMIEMISDDMTESEDRFRDIIQEAINNKETKSFKAFVNESKKKSAKRKAHYKKEAEEAEELKKELGLKIDEGEDSLRNMILARRKDASANFLDNLAAKYGAKEKAGKTKVFKAGKSSKKKIVDSDVENTPSDIEDEDCSPPSKKKSTKIRK